MIKRFLFLTIAAFVLSTASYAQNDPGKQEDAAIERQKILRATDQIDVLSDQVTKMQQELQTIRQDMEMMKTENYRLKQQMALDETKRIKERDVILAEVAKNIAKVSSQPSPQPKETPAPDAPPKKEKGYEHVVEKGETLWMIAKAYKDQGIVVSVADIRKANDLRSNQALKVGQKLFIPAPAK